MASESRLFRAKSIVIVDSRTEQEADPVLVDRKSGRPLVRSPFPSGRWTGRRRAHPPALLPPGHTTSTHSIDRHAGRLGRDKSRRHAMEGVVDTVVLERETTISKRNLKFRRNALLLTGFVLALLIGSLGYGRYWWSTGRFIESTDDAYAGGNVTPVAPHVAGSLRKSW